MSFEQELGRIEARQARQFQAIRNPGEKFYDLDGKLCTSISHVFEDHLDIVFLQDQFGFGLSKIPITYTNVIVYYEGGFLVLPATDFKGE